MKTMVSKTKTMIKSSSTILTIETSIDFQIKDSNNKAAALINKVR